jgi:hypothetical protein
MFKRRTVIRTVWIVFSAMVILSTIAFMMGAGR